MGLYTRACCLTAVKTDCGRCDEPLAACADGRLDLNMLITRIVPFWHSGTLTP